jgi:anti-sigma regulatory factor (Ser/Thr protein kinase)
MLSAGGPDAAGAAAGVIAMVLLADPVTLSVVRERFRRWLDLLRWPEQEIDDVVMAVNEAVSIAIQNVHPSRSGAEVHVAAKLFTEADGGRRVMIGVVGDDRWCPEPTDEDFRSPGMLMIHACMDAVEVSREPDVTTLMMSSVKVPPMR